MIYNLLYPLVEYFSPLNVLKYISIRSAYAAITALLIALIIGPWVIRKLRELKAGQAVRHDGPQSHLSKEGTPTMGGVLMIISVSLAIILWMDLKNPITWLLLFALLSFGGIGFVDDLLKILNKDSKGLSAWCKILWQFLVASICMIWIMQMAGYSSAFYLPFFKNPIFDLGNLFVLGGIDWGRLVWIPFGIFLMISWSNAVNVTDGLDGLASGLVIMLGVALALVAYLSGRFDYATYLQIPYIPWAGEVVIFCLALVGAVVGFLWFNSHPAEIFMGDTGSLAIGGTYGLISLLLKKEILMAILGGVFVMETISVILQVFWYKKTKKRFFRMAPLHHHFELSGWSETKVVIRFWILGGMFTVLGLSTLKLQ